MYDLRYTLLICGAFIILGVLFGNGAVYFFNKMPGKWLCDYDQEPSDELLKPTMQRVRSTPWKYVFTGAFIVAGIKMGLENPSYAFAALCSLWLLLEMSIADIKYMIVPDQLIMFLVITAAGFVPHHLFGTKDLIYGALIGFGITVFVALLGRIIHKKTVVGGGDIKLYTALGLVCGTDGIIFIFVASTFISAGHFIYLMTRKKARLSDERPMVPYIAIATAIYMIWVHNISFIFFI